MATAEIFPSLAPRSPLLAQTVQTIKIEWVEMVSDLQELGRNHYRYFGTEFVCKDLAKAFDSLVSFSRSVVTRTFIGCYLKRLVFMLFS